MSTLLAPIFFAIGTAAVTTGIQALVAPGPPDIPDLSGKEAAALGADAEEEARRRRLASTQVIVPGAVGSPAARVGTPTIVLGG